MNPFASPQAANRNFSNLQKITLEESCLILNVRSKDDFTQAFIDAQYDKWITQTKDISPYLADRIDAAYWRLKEELGG